jgi:hypothetical protein
LAIKNNLNTDLTLLNSKARRKTFVLDPKGQDKTNKTKHTEHNKNTPIEEAAEEHGIIDIP